MRRLLKLCAFLLSVWHASASVEPHYYCNIYRYDAVTGFFPHRFWAGWRSDISTEDAKAMFPWDEWEEDLVYFRFPTYHLHETLCSKMNAYAPLYDDGEYIGGKEVRGIGEVTNPSKRPIHPPTIYRAARMADRWTDTSNNIHDVFCFACRCNAPTPIPPQVQIIFAFYYI